jgi:hypothetical protein
MITSYRVFIIICVVIIARAFTQFLSEAWEIRNNKKYKDKF